VGGGWATVCDYCDVVGEEEVWVAGIDVVGDMIREKLGLAYKNATTDEKFRRYILRLS
jgi:hypothetical protein